MWKGWCASPSFLDPSTSLIPRGPATLFFPNRCPIPPSGVTSTIKQGKDAIPGSLSDSLSCRKHSQQDLVQQQSGTACSACSACMNPRIVHTHASTPMRPKAGPISFHRSSPDLLVLPALQPPPFHPFRRADKVSSSPPPSAGLQRRAIRGRDHAEHDGERELDVRIDGIWDAGCEGRGGERREWSSLMS